MKELILVLGMHRSGTSPLTRLFNLLGAAIAGDVLPPNADNPRGYWEPKSLVRLNNRLLEAAGVPWHDDRAIPACDLAADRSVREVRRFILESFDGHDRIVLKDPRLSRLFPLWRKASEDLGLRPLVVLTVRNPAEVALSLSRRAQDPAFEPAAVTDAARVDLLWSRYVLEAEYYSRGLARVAVDFEDLLGDPGGSTEEIVQALRLGISPEDVAAARPSIMEFLDFGSRRSIPSPSARSELPISSFVYAAFESHRFEIQDAGLQGELDKVRAAMEMVSRRFAGIDHRPQRAPAPSAAARQMSFRVRSSLLAGRPKAFSRVVFLSESHWTKGHIYRVENRIEPLRNAGIVADWTPVDDAQTADMVRDSDIVIAFRCEASEPLLSIRKFCRKQGIPWGVDFDDLVFLPELMEPKIIHFLAALPAEKQEYWKKRAERYRDTVSIADFAWSPTRTLARALSEFVQISTVLPNGLSSARLSQAELLGETREDGLIRIGYASGNPVHQVDFEQVVPALAELLAGHPNLRFVALGKLDTSAFDALQPVSAQIEHRKLVPFERLPAALAQFDINIAPLVRGNRFCEAKSELKFFEAGMVGIPTVATATGPFSDAIIDGETGLLVKERAEWKGAIGRLVTDSGERRRLGESARKAALANFGPEPQNDDVLAALASIPRARA